MLIDGQKDKHTNLIESANTSHSKARELADQLFQEIYNAHLKDRGLEGLIKGFYKKFTKAPASAWKDWHCAFPGGLLVHSVGVALRLDDICDIWFPECDLSSRAFVGLFHDLGKAGDLEQDFYLPETEQWWIEKKGRFFTYNENIVDIPHSIRSTYVLNQFGVMCTAEEFQAIAFHMDSDKEIKNKKEKLTLLLQWSDYMSARVDKV